MFFKFKPFYLETNAYFGSVLHNDACDEGGTDTTYQTSLKRALHYLTNQGHHPFETVFNGLTCLTSEVMNELPRFDFDFKDPEERTTLWQYLNNPTEK